MSSSKEPPLLHAGIEDTQGTIALFDVFGFDLAGKLLFHYFYGNGSTMELKYEELLRYSAMSEAHYQLQRRIKDAVQLKAISMPNDTVLKIDATDISFPHRAKDNLPYNWVNSYDYIWPPSLQSIDLIGAVGKANIFADPQIIITKQRGHIKLSGRVNYQFDDYYDFNLLVPKAGDDIWKKIDIALDNAGRQTLGFIGTALGTSKPLNFKDLDNLQKAGLAANFEITSNIHTEMAEDYF